MMNHHLPAVPHGQPPMPPPRRQHDIPYSTAPPNLRSPPAYMGYHPPHLNGHIPPAYAAQHYPHWYSSYPHMQPPPRPYQPPYAPLIVSSYPHSQPMMAPAHLPPPTFPLQPRTATSTPLQSTVSPPPPGPASGHVENQENPSANPPVNTASNPTVPSPASEPAKSAPAFRQPFRAPLPWLSVPDLPFPPRAPRRRRKPRAVKSAAMTVELPAKETQRKDSIASGQTENQDEAKPAEASAPAPSEPQTPTTSHAASEADSTQPTTPSSAVPQSSGRTPAQSQSQAKASKPSVPVVPVVPIVPGTPRPQAKDDTSRASVTPKPSAAETGQEAPAEPPAATSGDASEEPAKPASPPRAAPKSWADLVRSKTLPRGAGAPAPSSTESGDLTASRAESLVDVLNSLGTDVDQYSDTIAFIEPRGLVNTGNMCYMNSVLQILVYCIPFYEFLDHVGRRAAHSFKSDVPLIDAMIMFMREFRVIDAARSVEQLRLRLKQNELEQYGEAFIPEYVYQVIRQLPRFRDMRRGHQQDAQEFLGFLLEELHEECTRAAKSAAPAGSDVSTPTEVDAAAATEGPADGWLEVGHKQKPAITRSSGHIAFESPITRIFGGKIRSEFRVPGNKNSVTLEPYQPLQLDIGSPEVNNIIDALKGLTRPETIHGDFNSARGPNVTATKQIFIETLPPVLILHLKRFQYDSVTQGTQKIWKKIGYPLELEIPREVFPPHKRNAMAVHGGLPKYRLIGVIYHHGKNASGGHYTVDVRRQDGREWIRLDDTVIRRVRSKDVAEAGSGEDPKVLAAALEQHKRDKSANANIFDQFDPDDQDQADSERGWSQVNGAGSSGYSNKKTASNGVASPSASGASSGKRTPIGRYGTRDNKVAYLLFYQRITGL